MTPSLLRALLAFSLLLVAGTSAAQAYKWRDADGKLHFSDKPPAGANAEKMEIKPATPEDPEAVKQAQAAKSLREQAAFAEKQAKHKADQTAQRDQEANDRRCRSAQRDLDTFNRQTPVYHVGKDGQRVYMEDKDRPAAIQRAQSLVSRYCR